MSASEAMTVSASHALAPARKMLWLAGVSTLIGIFFWPSLVVSLPASLASLPLTKGASRAMRGLSLALCAFNVAVACAVGIYHALTT